MSVGSSNERTPLINPVISNKILEDPPSLGEAQRDQTDDTVTDNERTAEVSSPDFSIIATLLLDRSNIPDFNDFDSAEWLTTSFFLAACAAQPVLGKLSDIYGRKSMLIVAYVFFTAGNFLSGAGHQMWLVLLGRVIAGIGSGAGSSLVSILIADLVPLRSIAAWRSYVNIAATTGRSCGGPVGGILTDTVGWRWSFYGQCPLTILAIALVAVRLPNTTKEASYSEESSAIPASESLPKFRRIDFAGAITMVAFTLLLLFGIEIVSKNTSGVSTLSVCLIIGAMACAALFAVIEHKFAIEPIFPIRLMTSWDVLTTYSIGLFQMLAQVQLMFSVPLYFQIAMNTSTATAGVHLVPAVVGNALGGLLCGYAITKTGRYKLLTIGGVAFACLGYALVIARWHGQTNWAESFYIFPGGFGTGVVQSTTFIALTAGVAREDYAAAGSGLYQVMGIGGSISSCITMTILRSALRPLLEDALGAVNGKREIIERAIEDLFYARTLPESLRQLVMQCYVKALTYTHVSSLIFSALSLVVALSIQEHKI